MSDVRITHIGGPTTLLGLPLIAGSAASMEVLTPGGGGTELRMRFDLRTAAHTTG